MKTETTDYTEAFRIKNAKDLQAKLDGANRNRSTTQESKLNSNWKTPTFIRSR